MLFDAVATSCGSSRETVSTIFKGGGRPASSLLPFVLFGEGSWEEEGWGSLGIRRWRVDEVRVVKGRVDVEEAADNLVHFCRSALTAIIIFIRSPTLTIPVSFKVL